MTEQQFCHCMTVLEVETSIEAYLLSELTCVNKVYYYPLPDADEDFTGKKKADKTRVRNLSSELVSK